MREQQVPRFCTVTSFLLRMTASVLVLCGVLVGIALAGGHVSAAAQVLTMEYFQPEGFGSILIADIGRQMTANLTQGRVGWAAQPAWSPDGEHLAFTSEETAYALTSNRVYVLDYASYDTHLLLDVSWGVHRDLSWSPDGRWLALTSALDGSVGVFVVNADNGHFYRVSDTRIRNVEWPTWSLDGTQIAFVNSAIDDYNWNLHVVNADGSNPRILSMSSSWDSPPTWSPDGTQLVIAGYDNGVHVVSVELDRLTSRRIALGYTPVWSPVTDRIAFVMGRDTDAGNLSGAVYTIKSDGSELTPLYWDERSWIYQVLWSSDGSQLAAAVDCGARLRCIQVIQADGSDVRRVGEYFPWYDEDGALVWRP